MYVKQNKGMNKKEIHPKHKAFKVRAKIPEFIGVDKFGNEIHFNNAKEVKQFKTFDQWLKENK